MKITATEKLENSRVELTIAVEADVFEAALERAYRKNVMKMNVPGFRKGKTPRKMLEKIYGPAVFYEDAVDDTCSAAYDDALTETGLEPVDRADISIENIGAEGYTFKAVFTVWPEVTLGQYKGLSAVYPAAEVKESEVDAEIERLRERNSAIQTAERPAQAGDTVVFDYEGFIGGEPFEGGKGEQEQLVIGSNRFIPGFEDQFTGKSAGDAFEVNVTFPEEYHAEELAGKPAVFQCVLHEVKEKLLPDLDDEFAKDVSEYETLEELKTSLRGEFQEKRTAEAEAAFENALIGQVIDNMTADVPEVMIENELDGIIRDIEYNLKSRRLDMDMYLSVTGTTLEDMRNNHRDAAVKQVKAELALRAVAGAESIEVAEEELEAEYVRLSESYNMKVDTIKRTLPEKDLRRDLSKKKAAKIIIETAVKTDPPAEDTSDTPDAPVSPDTPDAPVSPDTPDAPVSPDTPDAPV